MTSDLQNTYLYDAEGRICAVKEPPVAGVTTMVGYLYDAEGNRIGKGSIQQWNCNTDTNGFSLTNEYVLGQSGEQVTELDGNGGWLHTNAYAGGQMIATYDPQGLHYQISDWLGNRRVQTNSTGAVELTWQNLPFGELNPSSTLGATEHHFTGKERDAESGLDYFGARYYASNMGRFLSPDWSAQYEPVPYAKLDNPQSLNLYSYVYNNPLRAIDVDGHDGCSTEGVGVSCSALNEGAHRDSSAQEKSANAMINAAQQNANRQPDGSYKATPDQLADLRSKADKKQHVYSPHDSDGQCVTACERFTGVPGPTTSWTRGKAAGDLTDADIGTAIATFDGDHYGGTPKNSGVFMGKGVGGIWFADQWPKADGNKPVSIWFMPTNDPHNPGNSAMSASYYHVIIVK